MLKSIQLSCLVALIVTSFSSSALIWASPLVQYSQQYQWKQVPVNVAAQVTSPIVFDNNNNIFYVSLDPGGNSSSMEEYNLSTQTGTDISYNLTSSQTMYYQFLNFVRDQQGDIYAAVQYGFVNQSSGLFELPAGATQWNSINTVPNGLQASFVAVDSNNNLFVAGFPLNEIYERPNGAASWTDVSLSNNYNGLQTNQGLYADTEGNLYAVATLANSDTQNADLLELSAGQTQWVAIAKNIPIVALTLDKNNNIFVTVQPFSPSTLVPANVYEIMNGSHQLKDLTFNLNTADSEAGVVVGPLAVDAYGDVFVEGGLSDNYFFELPAGSQTWIATDYTQSLTSSHITTLNTDNSGTILYAASGLYSKDIDNNKRGNNNTARLMPNNNK